MSGGMASKTIESIEQLQLHNPLEPIDLNGHGETTYREDWAQVCLALAERGMRVRLTSNFAKSFTEDELEALACMHSVAISIDTADRKLLRSVRRRVDLKQIVTNMALVKATALKLHRTAPVFGFLSGLYD